MTFDELIAISQAPEKLRRFTDAYAAAQTDGYVALQSALPMRELAPLMAQITLLEMESDDRITFRIAGETVVERFGTNPMGRNFLDLIEPDLRDVSAAGHKQMLDFPCGYYMVYENEYESGRRMVTETLTLPLRKQADMKPNLFLGFHIEHFVSGLCERAGETALVVNWQTKAFADIGAGRPDYDLMAALEPDSQTAMPAQNSPLFG